MRNSYASCIFVCATRQAQRPDAHGTAVRTRGGHGVARVALALAAHAQPLVKAARYCGRVRPLACAARATGRRLARTPRLGLCWLQSDHSPQGRRHGVHGRDRPVGAAHGRHESGGGGTRGSLDRFQHRRVWFLAKPGGCPAAGSCRGRTGGGAGCRRRGPGCGAQFARARRPARASAQPDRGKSPATGERTEWRRRPRRD